MEDNVSDQQGARGYHLARTSLICGVIGFSFWLLSYSWVPFALTGHKAGELVGYVVMVSEVGGLLVGLVSVGSGFIARRRSRATGWRLARIRVLAGWSKTRRCSL